MSRLFDGVDDRITFAPGTITQIHEGAQTYAYLIRLNANHRGGLFDGRDAGAARRIGINPFDNGDIFYNITGQGFLSFGYVTYVNTWIILVITKATGVSTPRTHIYSYGTGLWTHANLGGTLGNGATDLASFIIGSFDSGQWLSANLAVTAFWSGTALSDGALDGSTMPTQLSGWLALNPSACQAYNQAAAVDPVPDLTGHGAGSTLIEGTTISGTDPPGFSYSLGVDGVLAGTAAAATFSGTADAFTSGVLAGVASAATLTMSGDSTIPADSAVLTGVASAATLRLTGESDVADDCEWPVDPSCVPGWDDLPEIARENGIAWASFILKSLTGGRYTLCSKTVRPCYVPCQYRTYETYGVWWDGWGTGGGGQSWVPFIDTGGNWRNCGCFGACCCGVHCEVWLPGPISSITEVRINNVVLDPSAYRVDNGEYLVRQDGDCWPSYSNQTVPPDSTDHTFVVTYIEGEAVPRAGELAGGLLAGEFARACVGGDCAIPERVTSISRSGVSFELVSPTDEFDQGLTGITEVDRFIRAANPYQLKERPYVSSPDLAVPRMQTWP